MPDESNINQRVVARMAAELREFGYPGVTAADARDWVTAIEAGSVPDDVCAMLVHDWLADAGLIATERQP